MTEFDESADALDLRNELARLTRERDDATAKLVALQNSRWHQIGRTLRRAKSPRAWRTMLRDLRRAMRGSTATATTRGTASDLVGPATVIADGPIRRPDIKVAAILDTFSALAFRYEWDIDTGFGQDDWKERLTARRPDLLFVESAWHGNDDKWRLTMSTADAPRAPLRELVAWCQEQGIPTVFWNKEDPPNFERFIETAKLFDQVLTVDEDCVPRYVAELGHDRVGVLPFGAAPRIHNPIEVPGGRSREVAFGGTYFADKHAGRREQMETVLRPALEQGLEIFSRQDGKDKRYAFPDEYQPHVVGSLEYEQMLTAYKRYKVFLNVNSVTTSPSMCARRVFELSACRTAVLSGYSKAIPAFFDGLITLTTSQEETARDLRALLRQDELRERTAHRAMRLVMNDHTYGHRADQVLQVAGIAVPPESLRPPSVSVLFVTKRPEQVVHAVGQIARQLHRPLQLVAVLHGEGFDVAAAERTIRESGIEDFVVLARPSSVIFGDALNDGLAACDGDYVAKMDDDDVYGENYMTDQLHAFLYTNAEIVGKATHYVHLKDMGATMLRFPGLEHRYTYSVKGPTLVMRGSTLRELKFSSLPRAIDTDLLNRYRDREIPVYATDRYNFAFVRHSDATKHTYQIEDADLLKNGRITFYGPPEPHILV